MKEETSRITEQENEGSSFKGDYKEEKSNYNRGFGLFAIVAGGIFSILGIKNKSALITICATPLVIDGIGDLITGYHHYCLKNIRNYWS